LLLSLGVLAFGLAIALAGALGSWRALAPTLLTSDAVSLPTTFERHLDAGDYEVFQRTGTRDAGSGLFGSEEAPTTIRPGDVQVIGPDGSPVYVDLADVTGDTLTRGHAVYTGAVRFRAPTSGTYRISITAEGGFAEAIVTATIGEAFRRAVGWLLTLVAGALVALTGVVLLIVGATRRHRVVPAGWYADPGGTGRLRWWDGTAWTPHLW
jgi:hypothetical protein